MSISEIKCAYSEYYERYREAKGSFVDAAQGRGWFLNPLSHLTIAHHYAEQSYRRFKKLVLKRIQAHPHDAPLVNQILSNTRFLRHRQKLHERALYAGSQQTFLELVGNVEEVEEGVNQVDENLNELLEIAKSYQEKYRRNVRNFTEDCARERKELSAMYATADKTKDSEQLKAMIHNVKIQQMKSPKAQELKQDRERLKKTIEQIHGNYDELKGLLIRAVDLYRHAVDADQEKQSLVKLDRVRIKIARFKAFWSI